MTGSGYVAVIFSSMRTSDDADEYAAATTRMDELARRQPGFLGIESARGEDGFGITVSYWRTEADAVRWKRHAEHLAAQERGRATWYRRYHLRIAEVGREYSYDAAHADAHPGDAND